MKKKKFATNKDKKDWYSFIKNPSKIYDKEADLSRVGNEERKMEKLDLHGVSLVEANKKTKNFIFEYYDKGYKKLIVVTGKGQRSKAYNDPYISHEGGILKNSIPEYISKDLDLSRIVKSISKANIEDGGEGAIYIFLKNKLG